MVAEGALVTEGAAPVAGGSGLATPLVTGALGWRGQIGRAEWMKA